MYMMEVGETLNLIIKFLRVYHLGRESELTY